MLSAGRVQKLASTLRRLTNLPPDEIASIEALIRSLEQGVEANDRLGIGVVRRRPDIDPELIRQARDHEDVHALDEPALPTDPASATTETLYPPCPAYPHEVPPRGAMSLRAAGVGAAAFAAGALLSGGDAPQSGRRPVGSHPASPRAQPAPAVHKPAVPAAPHATVVHAATTLPLDPQHVALLEEVRYLLRLTARNNIKLSGPDNPSAGILARELSLVPKI
jgi:hypothetical protein